MDTTNIPDLLQIKIDKARESLSEDSRDAIDSVDWKKSILDIRDKKGYSYLQLEELEQETELLLYGLTSTKDYPMELEKRMGIQKSEVNELINYMNEKIFKKIREELIKITEKNNISPLTYKNTDSKIENIVKIAKEKKLEEIKNTPAKTEKAEQELDMNEKELPPGKLEDSNQITLQKLSGSFQIPKKETEHTIPNLTKNDLGEKKLPKVDPYREQVD